MSKDRDIYTNSSTNSSTNSIDDADAEGHAVATPADITAETTQTPEEDGTAEAHIYIRE